MSCDVIVVGAGPAGCAAAIELALAGRSVLLFERGELPQAKTCGDLLLPPALRALESLGVVAGVHAAGLTLTEMQLQSPGRLSVTLPLTGVSLQRPQLHALLQQRAMALGVVLQRAEVVGPLKEDGAPAGVRYRDLLGEEQTVRAPLVLLASGCRSATLAAFGVEMRAEPTAVGIRCYYRDLDGESSSCAHIGLQRQLGPGFGWVIPLPGGIYNIGCGRLLNGVRAESINLRQMLDAFIHSFEPAWRVIGHEDPVGIPCSGLLRSGLCGSRAFRDGLLVAGDAVGSAAPLVGTGIAAALQSGQCAAQVALTALRDGDLSAAGLADYERRLAELLQPRYRALTQAEQWYASPRRLDQLARQARRKPATAALLADLVTEGTAAEQLFSLRGLLGFARKA